MRAAGRGLPGLRTAQPLPGAPASEARPGRPLGPDHQGWKWGRVLGGVPLLEREVSVKTNALLFLL